MRVSFSKRATVEVFAVESIASIFILIPLDYYSSVLCAFCHAFNCHAISIFRNCIWNIFAPFANANSFCPIIWIRNTVWIVTSRTHSNPYPIYPCVGHIVLDCPMVFSHATSIYHGTSSPEPSGMSMKPSGPGWGAAPEDLRPDPPATSLSFGSLQALPCRTSSATHVKRRRVCS